MSAMLTAYRLRATARAAQARLHQKACKSPPALLVTDLQRLACPETLVSRLPRGWGIIYRHFGETSRVRRARALVAGARRRHLSVQIAADPELARSSRADGLHWPERLWQSRAGRDWRRRTLGKSRGGVRPIVSIAAHSRRALACNRLRGADVVLVSPVFASNSRSAARVPLGRQRFRQLACHSSLPCYALGGIGRQQVANAPFAALESIRDLFGEDIA